MTLGSKGEVIYASKAEVGKFYVTVKSGILVKFLKFTKDGRVVLESSETGNEVTVSQIYLLRVVTQQEVEKVMAKKETEGKVKKTGNGVKKVSKVCIDYNLLAPFLKSGLPVKVKDLLEKVKVEKTSCSPYFRVYSTLEKAKKEGILKFLGKGTFQLVGSNKVAEPKPEKPVVKAEKPKEKAKAKPKVAKPAKAPKEPVKQAPEPEKAQEEAPL